jgi:nucleotide-binding universal stress UspA family protein
MYKRVLVAVDGSKISNLALKEAIRLAKEQRASLRLIHVVDVTPVYITMGEIPYSTDVYEKSMREGGRKVLAACAAKARADRVKFDTKFVAITNLATRIWDVVNKEAKRWRADVIVIGTHGRHGFNRLFLGSVAEGVIRLAEKPVLDSRAMSPCVGNACHLRNPINVLRV